MLLQHTAATRCHNTLLQHTAATCCCNMLLQHTATRCNTLPHTLQAVKALMDKVGRVA